MSDPANSAPTFLAEFVLARLLFAGKTAPTAKAVATDLAPFFQTRNGYSPSEWAARVDVALKALETRGLAQKRKLTDAGRTAALATFGVEKVPAKATFKKWGVESLALRALGLTAADEKRRKDALKADRYCAIGLARHHGLDASGEPTASAVFDALAWKALRNGSPAKPVDGKFSRGSVLQAVYAPDRQDPKQKSDSQLALLLAVAAFGVKGKLMKGKEKFTVADVQIAMINRWLDERDAAGRPPEAPPLKRFADAVRRLSSTLLDGERWGDKVFIAPVWERFRSLAEAGGMSRPEFDARLVEANKTGLLTLSRADLVSAMPVELVNRSEIRLPDMTYHLIRTDR